MKAAKRSQSGSFAIKVCVSHDNMCVYHMLN
jgi:hypothetical protein